MEPSISTRLRLGFVGLLLMWLASIAREPGGLPAFAAELASAERAIGEVVRHVPTTFSDLESDGTTITGYAGGVLCESSPGATAAASGLHCQSVFELGE